MDNSQTEHAQVLVVEDEPLLLEAITKKLELDGFHVLPFADGNKALAVLKDEPIKPEVIWLDYYLKDINGLDFMHALKADPTIADIPVVVVSNSASDQKVQTMLDLGVKRYLLKAEYRLERLVEIVKNVLLEHKKE